MVFSTLKQSLPSCGISQTDGSKFERVLSLDTKDAFKIAGTVPLSTISPFSIIFTKGDKLGKNALAAQVEANKKTLLQYWEELPPIFVTSSETGFGKEDLLEYIESVLGIIKENKNIIPYFPAIIFDNQLAGFKNLIDEINTDRIIFTENTGLMFYAKQKGLFSLLMVLFFLTGAINYNRNGRSYASTSGIFGIKDTKKVYKYSFSFCDWCDKVLLISPLLLLSIHEVIRGLLRV